MKTIVIYINGKEYEIGLKDEIAAVVEGELERDFGGNRLVIKDLLKAYIKKSLEKKENYEFLQQLDDELSKIN
jgi:hypothetical protein